MALTLQTTGNVIYASTINQCIYVLQRQHGQTETGKYFIEGNSYRSYSLYQSCCLPLLCRSSTPVSIAIDTADNAPSSLVSPSTSHLKAGIVQVYADSNAGTLDCYVGGNYTVQY